jgi:predicted metalloendopeptidase
MLRDWWTKDSRAHFDAQTRVLVDQFNAYEPIAGTRIKGELTLGENIGDLGGMTIAYNAYRKFLKDSNNRRGTGARRAERRPTILPVLGTGVAQHPDR